MLSLSKHLYHATRVSNSYEAVEMLRQAQHDVLVAGWKIATPLCYFNSAFSAAITSGFGMQFLNLIFSRITGKSAADFTSTG